jgi:hypothetical protein
MEEDFSCGIIDCLLFVRIGDSRIGYYRLRTAGRICFGKKCFYLFFRQLKVFS